ncbi:MAG: exo-alpha-sialidase [Lentisphaerae bacterium]|nr:exo-alpha-sialidase [Lentisphaerota bacterium]
MSKQMKIFAGLLAGVAVFCSPAEEYPYGTIILNGGRLEPICATAVENHNGNMNFCFAHRFADGKIYLTHSKGIHTISESRCRDFSTDGGLTWQHTPCNFGGFNAYTMLDGRKANIVGWDENISEKHRITRIILAADGTSTESFTSEITLPYASSFKLHREIIRTGDNRLLLTGYGYKQGARKLHSFVIESVDDGNSWRYLSTLMEDLEDKYTEGPNESAVIELANGDLLAVCRVSSDASLHQLRSKDGGKSWQYEREIAPFSVAPAMRVMQNGALVIISGRPKLYLLIDFTGTGENYQKVCIYSGAGSSYASIMETAPNELLIIYDESDFGSWRSQRAFSQITAMKYKVVKDDSMTSGQSAGEWLQHIIPQADMDPGKIFRNYYPVRSGSAESWYEIKNIAERPNPVIRLNNRGIKSEYKFSSFLLPFPRDTEMFTGMLEFRLLDPAEKRPQFGVTIALENPDGGVRYAWFGFCSDRILYRNGDNRHDAVYKVDLGVNEFHRIRVFADLRQNRCILLLDGKPVITARLTDFSNQMAVGFRFGDGAGAIFGAVDVSEIAWKFSE